jgi:NTP pyrophosphatase (non-canonical NTP hydrolase)
MSYGVTEFDEQLQDIVRELRRANQTHPRPFASAHEGYAVLIEEVDELWDEIKRSKVDRVALRKEAVQVAAMALKFLVQVCDR